MEETKINKNFVFMACDVQATLTKYIKGYETLVEYSAKLCQLSKATNNPLIIVEGNTKTFGHTDEALFKSIGLETDQYDGYADGQAFIHEKCSFSMFEDETTKARFFEFYDKEKTVAVLFGILTEACILKSVVSLRQQGVHRIVVVDEATHSMVEKEREVALVRLAGLGAQILKYADLEAAVNDGVQLPEKTENDGFLLKTLTRDQVVFFQGSGETTDPALLHNIDRITQYAAVFDPPIPVVKDLSEQPDRALVVIFGAGFTPEQTSLEGKDYWQAVDCIDQVVEAGVIKTTFESMIFEMITGYKDSEFKPILKLAKARAPKKE